MGDRIRMRDGSSLFRTRTGSGPPVVLLHHGFQDGRSWTPVAEILAAEHTVVVVDRRGHGRSDPYADGYRLEDEMGDLGEIADDLTAELGRPAVVAHSAAGHVALGAALGGAAIDRLVMYETPLMGFPPIHDRTWAALDGAVQAGDRRRIVGLVMNDVVGRSTGRILSAGDLTRLLDGPSGRLLLDNALTAPVSLRALEARRWTDDELLALTTPTTFLIGENSPPFNRRFGDRVAQLSHAAHVEVVEGADHDAPAIAPDRLAAVLQRLLA